MKKHSKQNSAGPNLFGDNEPVPLPLPPPPVARAARAAEPARNFEHLAEVAVERPMRHTYTFGADDVHAQLVLGARVLVPFGKATAEGIYMGAKSVEEFRAAGFDASKLKPIVKVLSGESAALTPELMQLARWMARHYVCPIGMVLKSMLPAGVKASKSAKKIEFVSTHFDANQLHIHASGLAIRKKKQAAILRALAAHPLGSEVEVKTLLLEAGSNSSALKALEKSRFLKRVEKFKWAVDASQAIARSDNLVLNDEQQQALKPIEAALDEGQASGFLLQGVTGSGKTEVYLRALQKALALGRQAIVLIPEIALTPQTAGRFQSRLGRARVAVLASDEAPGQRADIWRAIRAGEIDVVVGARSALYAPLPRRGIIVVDEDHDSSYKSPAAPRYNARDAAIALAQIARATIVLGSATPCFESYEAAQRGRLTHLLLHQRATGQPLPEVDVIDMAQENQDAKRYVFISRLLRSKLDDTLARGEQAILFLNRRGFSPVNRCLHCGATEKCARCDVSLTCHRDNNTLVCHYCNAIKSCSRACTVCGSPHMANWGMGTERVESEIRAMFPSARIARMDGDTMKNSAQYAHTLDAFKARTLDVLIGTQMIAKGLDFPAVTLVGVVAADTALHIPDFRSRERTFQLISQVAGRAGRSELGGRVIVQTHMPGDISIRCAAQHDFEAFFLSESQERRAFGYPPYGKFARLVFSSKNKTALESSAQSIAALIAQMTAANPSLKKIQILGPSDPPISKIRDAFRKHLMLKAATSAQLSELLDGPVADALLKLPHTVKALIDIDALSML